MKLIARTSFALGMLLALAACATTQSLDSRIHTANVGVTIVTQSTSKALNAKVISSTQAQSVSTIAHQLNPLLDSAKAASDANDPKNADKTMRLVEALLAGLDAYVPPTK